MKIFFIAIFFALSFPLASFASWPGSCTQIFYKINSQGTLQVQAYPTVTFDSSSGLMSFGTKSSVINQHYYNVLSHVCYFENGKWLIHQEYSRVLSDDAYAALISLGAVSSENSQSAWLAAMPGCPVPTCASKSGQVNYDLQNYSNPSSPPVGGNVCYDDCQQSAEILWTDCIGSSCIASVKYTATGQSCGVETSVDNLQTDLPKRCTDEINEKIQQCGGSLKVLSFDFETCTGECTPDSCTDEWNALVQKCGGMMAVSSWNSDTCSGSCASDPLPDASDDDSETVPGEVKTETKTNSDGTKEITQTTTYNVDNQTYTQTTITSYDAEGNSTGSSTSTTSQPTEDSDSESFSSITTSGFTEPYNPGEYDISGRFSQFLNNVKSSGLFSFSNDFFNSLPGGGSPIYEIEAGQYGHHTIDLSDTLSTGLAVLKTILLVCFGFLSIRAVIMKR